MRQERFKMEREGLVEEGQEVEISERSPSTGRYTYLVEPSVAMSGIYRTNDRIKARKGRVIAVVSEGDDFISRIADTVIEVPTSLECLDPLLSTIPLQLLAQLCPH